MTPNVVQSGLVQISDLAKLISRAIARQEGWLKPSSTQFANRNPGNIYDPKRTRDSGKFTFRTYPTFEAGWLDLGSLVQRQLLNRKLSLFEFFAGQRDSIGAVVPNGYPGFAPAAHGNNRPKQYAENVSAFINIPATTPASLDWLVRAKPMVKLPVWLGTTSQDVSLEL